MQAAVTRSRCRLGPRRTLQSPSLGAWADSWSTRPTAGSSLEGEKLWRKKKSCISSTSVCLCNNPSPSFVPTEKQSEGTERGSRESSLCTIYLNLCFCSWSTQVFKDTVSRGENILSQAGWMCMLLNFSVRVSACESLCSETVGRVTTSERIHIWLAPVWRHTGSHLCGPSSRTTQLANVKSA